MESKKKKEGKGMPKKLLEMLEAINQKKAEVRSLVEENKMDEAKKAKDELKDMQNKFDILKDIIDDEEEKAKSAIRAGQMSSVEPVVDPENKRNAVSEFANAARTGFRNSMNEGTKADGGYTVPEDIQTQINLHREAKASLQDLVDVEVVSTNKGSRTYKKRAQQTGFTKVGESAKIGAGTTPQFEVIEYDIEKYAGYFPVTNELLADSDANIADTLVSWIGDESRVTRNKLILDAIATSSKTAIAGLDDIKKALNVTLGQAFKGTSKIITNDDGLQYLDTLKDTDGRYILQPNPASPMDMVVCAGATAVPVFVVPNADLKSDTTSTPGTTKIPMIIGDMFEAVKLFDRAQLTIMTSNIASAGTLNAFEDDLTLFKATEREDVVVKDTSAIVYGEISVK